MVVFGKESPHAYIQICKALKRSIFINPLKNKGNKSCTCKIYEPRLMAVHAPPPLYGDKQAVRRSRFRNVTLWVIWQFVTRCPSPRHLCESWWEKSITEGGSLPQEASIFEPRSPACLKKGSRGTEHLRRRLVYRLFFLLRYKDKI